MPSAHRGYRQIIRDQPKPPACFMRPGPSDLTVRDACSNHAAIHFGNGCATLGPLCQCLHLHHGLKSMGHCVNIMLSNRNCAECGEPALAFASRKIEVLNSVYNYKCTGCGHEVKLVPVASLGLQIMVYLLATAFLWVLFFADATSNDVATVMIFFGAMAIMPGIILVELKKHRTYPRVGAPASSAIVEGGAVTHIFKKPMNWFESQSLLLGLLAPLLLIGVVLGAATVVGYINFTYFQ